MDAAAFNALFDEVVGVPLGALGFTASGRRLDYQDEAIQVALARTERRYQPPAELTLLYRHRFLRDRSETVPTKPPREPLDYPIAAAPSSLPAVLAGGWVYKPGRGSGLSDVIDYPKLDEPAVRLRLGAVADHIVDAWPQLPEVWSPAAVQAVMVARGDAMWWVERLWLDDYEAAERRNGGAGGDGGG